MANTDSSSEEELLREESTLGPPYSGSMFAALLNQMKKMNENILATSEPTEPNEKFPERKNNGPGINR